MNESNDKAARIAASRKAAAETRIRKSKEALKETMFSFATGESGEPIRVEEVCKNAGVSQATFYKYHEDIRHLFSSVLNDELERSYSRTVEACKSLSDDQSHNDHESLFLAILVVNITNSLMKFERANRNYLYNNIAIRKIALFLEVGAVTSQHKHNLEDYMELRDSIDPEFRIRMKSTARYHAVGIANYVCGNHDADVEATARFLCELILPTFPLIKDRDALAEWGTVFATARRHFFEHYNTEMEIEYPIPATEPE